MMLNFITSRKKGLIAFIIIIVVLTPLFIIRPESSLMQDVLNNLCISFRAPITIYCYFCLAVLLFLVFSKYGNIRLGGADAKPEYSTFSWFSCLFMAGMGVGLLFYSQEPILHLHNNPYVGNVPGEAIPLAYSLTLFNWTINDWIQYALLGVIIAYFHYNRGMSLNMSSILPQKVPTWIKNGVDIIMGIGVIAGLTTSMGLGVKQICNGFSYVFHINVNPYLLMSIITCIGVWSVTSGLKRGVKWLSNINMTFVFILLVSILLIGLFILDIHGYIGYMIDGVCLLFRNYFNYNDFYNSNSDKWAASYPLFFDLWFAAWAAFVSVFVAKISKGRTIREFIIGVVLIPSIFTIIWFGIFGRIGIEYNELIYKTMSNDISTALFIFFKNIVSNHQWFILYSAFLLCIICLFFITSSDSGSYVVATLLTNKKPKTSDKIFWAMVQGCVAMILFTCGGLAMIQSASVILGILVIILIIIGTIFFLREIIKKQ